MLLHIHPDNPNPRHIKTVVECLLDGGVIIYPTDTIYGLGCDIFQHKSIEKICTNKPDISQEVSGFVFIKYQFRLVKCSLLDYYAFLNIKKLPFFLYRCRNRKFITPLQFFDDLLHLFSDTTPAFCI